MANTLAAMMLFVAVAMAADDHDGHDHGTAASYSCGSDDYEWAAMFATPGATYHWNAYKTTSTAGASCTYPPDASCAYADAHMNMVFLPETAATWSAALEAEAHDGFSHTPCTEVEPGETIVPAAHKCFMLHFEGDNSSFVIDADSPYVAIFAQHNPSEFEIDGFHYLTDATTGADIEPSGTPVGKQSACPPSSPASSPPLAPEKSKDPCFSETATACRLDDASTHPATAFAQCFGQEPPTGVAARVSLRALQAGDVVLASPTEAARVIVNQHSAVGLASDVLVIEHSHGTLALTPDHVLWADGAFRPAAEVSVGSVLEPAAIVTKITAATHAVVNPLTTSGTILAAGPTGAPVVASTFSAWIADLLLDTALPYPLPYSAAAAAAYLFPASVQAFYDEKLEPLFSRTATELKELKAAVPAPVALAILLGMDVALVAAWAVWGTCSLKGVAAALLFIGATARARKA
eukprot:Transcript_27758.p1 GENE.Transcript_27758~~Transcript_27758.p1  ORF type:complete len:465 (+),score=143.08 Transcript_27758:93-1487(+)